MAFESNTSSLVWDSTSSPLQFQSSSLSHIPSRYDLSLIAPLRLTQRKCNSHSTVLQLPPLKLRSTLTWRSTEEENFLSKSITSSDQELIIFKQKFDRLRASLSQALEDNRHTFDIAHYKKNGTQQMNDERDELIDQLLAISFEMNDTIKDIKNEISKQRRQRDKQEMRQSKLQRMLIHLNDTKDKSIEVLKTNDKEKLIEQYDSHLSQLKNEYKQELTNRDNEIKELKENLSEEFTYQADEHMKLLRATEQALNLQSQKRDVLKGFVENYETNIYRATKPCCLATSNRLSTVATQLRLHSIMELSLHELFHSSCSCGKFKRSYQTFIRLHTK